MTQTNDGGPAFPHLDLYTGAGNPHPTPVQYNGMSLRDWFAAHASDSDVLYHRSQLYHAGGYIKEPTREECKYAYADAMIAARAKERG